MAERAWFEFGWNQTERVYEQYYRGAKVEEGMAIQLNDFFTLGATLGIPALGCLVLYVGLSLKFKVLSLGSKVGGPRSGAAGVDAAGLPAMEFRLRTFGSPAVCRGAAVVLLVGSWFDGGLFKLATGATFWVLLELGNCETGV
jgi:hypothetical protein